MTSNNLFLFFALLISTLAMTILYQPFLFNLTIALLLVISTTSIKKFFAKKIKNHFLLSLFLTLLLTILLFAPIVYVVTVSAISINKIDPEVFQNIEPTLLAWVENAPAYLQSITPNIESYINDININGLASNAVQIIADIGAKSAGFFKNMTLIIIFYFFILYNKAVFIEFFINSIPNIKKTTTQVSQKISNVMGVVFYSILATAIFEGGLFALLAYYLSYDAILLGILYGFASLIPVVGGILMWLPLALYEFSIGHTNNALIIIIYTIVVISIIADTFIKPLIIKHIDTIVLENEKSLNEMLIFFSMIAGLSTFGFWGLIIGPAITTLFVTIVDLYAEAIRNKKE